MNKTTFDSSYHSVVPWNIENQNEHLNEILIHSMSISLKNAKKRQISDEQIFTSLSGCELSRSELSRCELSSKFPLPNLKRTCGLYETCAGPEPCGSIRCCFLT